jgi:hypothetical protein
MKAELDALEELAGQASFGGRRRGGLDFMGISPGLQRAKVARPPKNESTATPSPAKPVLAAQSAPVRTSWLVTSKPELVQMIRDAKGLAGISNETLDRLAGLSDRHIGKLLGPNPSKTFGPMSLQCVLDALALRIVRVEFTIDPEAAARLAPRWVKRREVGGAVAARKREAQPMPPPMCALGTLIEQNVRETVASTTETDHSNVQHETEHHVPNDG